MLNVTQVWDSLRHNVKYGLESRFPKCCVTWFSLVYHQLYCLDLHHRYWGWVKSRNTGYIPCPWCVLTNRKPVPRSTTRTASGLGVSYHDGGFSQTAIALTDFPTDFDRLVRELAREGITYRIRTGTVNGVYHDYLVFLDQVIQIDGWGNVVKTNLTPSDVAGFYDFEED